MDNKIRHISQEKRTEVHKSCLIGFHQGSVKFSLHRRGFIILYIDLFVVVLALNVFLECISKFKSSDLDSQLSFGGKFTLIENFIYLALVWL